MDVAPKPQPDVPLLKNYIAGRWVEGGAGRVIDNVNPATGEVLARVSLASRQDIERAVEVAAEAQRRWRKLPAPRRGEILYRAGQLLLEHKEELARTMTREMGKVLPEARGDVQEAIDMAFYMGGEGRRLFGHTVPAEMPDKFAMAVRDPVGVVAAITPWNFPVAIPSWKIFPALVAGNAVVFKPASDTPWCAQKFVEILVEAGLPEGVLNLVYGAGQVAGAALVEHPRVNVITFTGSNETGRWVNEKAGGLLKRVHLELGGKNAITVMDDADLDLAVEGILWSAFGTTGQRCTAGSRVIVHRAVKRDLEERLVARATAMRLGDGLEPTTDVGPLINVRQRDRVHEYVEIGKAEGAKLLCGGRPATDGPLARGAFYQPTIFTDCRADMRIAQEEIFGPVTSLIPVNDFDEAIAVNNSVTYGLSSSIYTRDVQKAFRAMRDLDTGIVYVNHGTIGAEIQLPFGGTKGTGNGHREAAWAALDVMTEWKSIYVDFSGKLQRAQIDEVKLEG